MSLPLTANWMICKNRERGVERAVVGGAKKTCDMDLASSGAGGWGREKVVTLKNEKTRERYKLLNPLNGGSPMEGGT